jgi:hypothetical protein
MKRYKTLSRNAGKATLELYGRICFGRINNADDYRSTPADLASHQGIALDLVTLTPCLFQRD